MPQSPQMAALEGIQELLLLLTLDLRNVLYIVDVAMKRQKEGTIDDQPQPTAPPPHFPEEDWPIGLGEPGNQQFCPDREWG